MNILSVTNALKEIKLKDLDDEFQTTILSRLNIHLPEGIVVTTDVSGNDIRLIFDEIIDPFVKLKILELNIIDNRDIVRFFNNVEKVQQYKIREVEYDDAIKGNFISTFSLFVTICVGILMGIYVTTDNSRGVIPESRVLSMAATVVDSLAEVHGASGEQPSGSE